MIFHTDKWKYVNAQFHIGKFERASDESVCDESEFNWVMTNVPVALWAALRPYD